MSPPPPAFTRLRPSQFGAIYLGEPNELGRTGITSRLAQEHDAKDRQAPIQEVILRATFNFNDPTKEPLSTGIPMLVCLTKNEREAFEQSRQKTYAAFITTPAGATIANAIELAFITYCSQFPKFIRPFMQQAQQNAEKAKRN